MPVWSLAITYWLHLLATVMWIGGLAMLALIAWPGSDGMGNPTLDALERRFRPWANVSLAILLVTGLIQMGSDKHYEGFLAINSVWAIGLLAKHILIGGMVGISAMLQWSVYPALERARLLARRSASGEDEVMARRQLRRLTVINLALGVLVLLFTAVITAF
jgi:uncharacterized membrane protein